MRLWQPHHPPSLTLGTYGPSLLRRRFRLDPQGIARHRHIMGITGQGKSKLMASLFIQTVQQGIGAALIDPHADLATDVLAQLSSSGFFASPRAFERLLYVDFSNPTRALPFNVLNEPAFPPHTVAQHLAEVCKRAWAALADGAAPQFENILLSSVVVLVVNKQPLTSLPRLLTDKPYRDNLLRQVDDPQIVGFFHDRFDRWGREAPLMIESTLRRVFLLTFSPTLRSCLGQQQNALDFRRLMDSGASVIFNLGGLDEDTQRFLGCLLTVGFENAALSRADLPEDERRPYHLFMDEFSMFSAQSEESLARVLSLARKYGLFMTMAHQTWSQVSERLQGALQNAIEIAFAVGRTDAEWAAPRFGHFDPYLVKHEVPDPNAVGRTHPVFFGLQEQVEGWVNALEALRPREAFVAVGKKTVKLRTLTIPRPTCTPEQLRQLIDGYARRLLTPREQVQSDVGEVRPLRESVVRRRG